MVAYKRGKRRKKQTGDFKRDQKDQIRKGRLERERESDEWRKEKGKGSEREVQDRRSGMTTLEK